MDLESESSFPESVEDNGFIGEVIEDTLVSASKDDKESNSQVETSHPISKGFGLRKWRRLRRRDLSKDTSVDMENNKILKRVLSGSADSHAKQIHLQSPDGKQDSLSSVGSVNNNVVGFGIVGSSHGTGLAFSIDSDISEDQSSKSSTAASGPKARYERKEAHSWDKQRGRFLGGNSVVSLGDSGQRRQSSVEKSKKPRGERIKIEKENSHSSMESADSRSSNFVFMQGASFSMSSREQDGRRMMDYNEENSDHDAHTSNRKDDVGEEEEEEEETEDYSQGDSVEVSQIKNNGSSDILDPLTEAFNSFHTLQEALGKELQKFQELGKEPMSSLRDGGESSSCIHLGHERASEASSSRGVGHETMEELGLATLDSEILNLVNIVEHLEIKLEETKCILEVKESQIRELESTISISEPRSRGTVIGMEEIFRQKMEAEIEDLIFSRSVANLKRRIRLIEEEKTLAENEALKMLSKLGEAQTKAENLKNQAQELQNDCIEITEIQQVKSFKKRVLRTTSCLLLQLGLLFMLFNFQLMPEPDTNVPT